MLYIYWIHPADSLNFKIFQDDSEVYEYFSLDKACHIGLTLWEFDVTWESWWVSIVDGKGPYWIPISKDKVPDSVLLMHSLQEIPA